VIARHVQKRTIFAPVVEELIDRFDDTASHAGAHALEGGGDGGRGELFYLGGEGLSLLVFFVVLTVIFVHLAACCKLTQGNLFCLQTSAAMAMQIMQ